MNLSDLGLPIPLGALASLNSLTISKEVYLPDLSPGLTYPLDTFAPFGYTVNEVYQIQTSSGSVTAALKINGTNITGLSGISVTSTPQNVAATGANTMAVGDALSLVFSSNSSAQNVQFTLSATRSFTNFMISKQVFLPDLSTGLTYPLDTFAPFGYTVNELYQAQTSSGSVTAALQINNGSGFTNITGLSGLSLNSTGPFTNYAATGANTVSSGGALQVVFSSNSSAQNVQFTVAATRTF